MEKKLYRSRQDRIIFGLCGGLGNYFGINPWAFRLIFIFTGTVFWAYFILCIFVPEEPYL